MSERDAHCVLDLEEIVEEEIPHSLEFDFFDQITVCTSFQNFFDVTLFRCLDLVSETVCRKVIQKSSRIDYSLIIIYPDLIFVFFMLKRIFFE